MAIHAGGGRELSEQLQEPGSLSLSHALQLVGRPGPGRLPKGKAPAVAARGSRTR